MEQKNILLIEDNAIIVVQLQNMLVNLGYDVREPLATGEAAIAAVAANLPDLILMDIQLAGEMDAITAAERIRSAADIPIVFLISYPQNTLLQRAKITEPYGYLIKPTSPLQLMVTIDTAIYKHRIDCRLKQSEARYKSLYHLIRLLCDNVPDMIWAKDLDKRYFFVNQAACTGFLNARDTDEPIGKTDIFFAVREKASHPDQPGWHTFGTICNDSDDRVISTERAQRFEESGNVNGRPLVLDVHKTPFWNEQGNLIGIVGCARDITREKQLEAERRQAEAEIAELEAQNRQLQKDQSLRCMAGAIAHIYNNHLQVIIGNLDMAMDFQLQGEDLNVVLNESLMAARRAAEVSTLMLTYLGQTSATREHQDISETCGRSLPMLRATLPQGVILKAELSSPGPTIHASEKQIQLVLTHLVNNAQEAIDAGGGAIRLSTQTVSAAEIPASSRFPIDWRPQNIAYACLEVSDTGCGISNQNIEKIFDPFFTTKFTGRGLGLSVILGIVRAHGGAVAVESEPIRGSTFSVFLPVGTSDEGGQYEYINRG